MTICIWVNSFLVAAYRNLIVARYFSVDDYAI